MAIQAKMKGDNRVVTGMVRFAFLNVFEPRKNDEGTVGDKYSVCVLIDKKDTETIKCINKAIEAAKAKGVSERWGNKMPKNLQLPLRDGDEKEDDQYSDTFKGVMFMNPKSKSRPAVVDKHGARIIDPDEFYSGCYGLVSLSFYPYDVNGNKGVGVALDNIMKLKDGDSLAGKPSAESDFDGVDYEDEDDDI